MKSLKDSHNKKIILSILGISFLFFLFVLVITIINLSSNSLGYLIATSEIDVFFMIGENPGFAVEKEYLHFGMVTPGGSSKKEMTIRGLENDVFVVVSFDDNVSQHIRASPNNFVLEKNQEQLLNLSLTNTHNLSIGNYTGKMIISYYEYS
jgi:hypothetical protein